MEDAIIVHTDGGARGNPGPAAIGVVITRGGKKIAAFGKTIGEATNNVAEYTAVVEALRYLKTHALGAPTIRFVLDSVLVANQLTGTFKVKNPDLRLLLFEVRKLEQEAGGSITYRAVPRAQNYAADALVNEALDG